MAAQHPDTWEWTKVPGASAAWESPDRRWMIYMRDGSWISRDRHLPTIAREHHRDQEAAWYSPADMLDSIAHVLACESAR